MKNKFLRALILPLSLCMLIFTVKPAVAVPYSSLPNLNLLTPYATFGNYFNDNNVTINGDAGISANGTLKLEAPSSITGDVDLGTNVTTSGGGWDGNVGGNIAYNQDLFAAQAQVYSAANTLALLTADFTYSSLSAGLTVAANGPVTVVNVENDVDLGSGDNIIFTGSASDYFVLNIFGDLDMSGNAVIDGDGGASASNILINLYSSNSLGNIAHVDNIINGTLLIPNATYAELHSVNGAIYSGNGEIKLMSGSRTDYNPYTPAQVPEPATMLLLGTGLLGFAGITKRKCTGS